MTLFRTKNGVQTGVVPGVGVIVNGMIESPVKLEGNFEEVTPQPQPTVQAPAPAAPVASQPVQPVAPAANPQPVQNTNTQGVN